MKSCLRCVAGVAYCAAGVDDADANCVDPGGTPSGGYHVVQITTPGDLRTCTLPSSITKPGLFTRCSSMTSTPTGTYLSVYVNEWCGGECRGGAVGCLWRCCGWCARGGGRAAGLHMRRTHSVFGERAAAPPPHCVHRRRACSRRAPF